MVFERRVHYRRQNHYATKSNKYKIVKTPGKCRCRAPAPLPSRCLIFLCRWQAHDPLLEEIG